MMKKTAFVLFGLLFQLGWPVKSLEAEERPRIVVVGTSMYLDILKMYGDLSLVVGVLDSSNNPAEMAAIPKVGVALLVNTEAVLAARPDIVLGVVEPLRSKLPPGIRFRSGESMMEQISDIKALIREVGVLLKKSQHTVDEILGQFDAHIQAEVKRVKRCEKKTVALIFPSLEGEIYTIGSSSVENEVIALAHGINVLVESGKGKSVPIEALLKKNPSILLTDTSMVKRIEKDARLLHLKAVKTGRVIGLKTADFSSVMLPDLLGRLIDEFHGGSGCLSWKGAL